MERTAQSGAEAQASALQADPHKSIAKITADREELDLLREQGIEKVTLVRVTADMAESKRRQAEDTARRERFLKLEDDRLASTRMFDDILQKWDTALSHTDAEELRTALDEQKKACAALIGRKDALISELQGQLKAKDDEFVKDLRTQTQDIDALLGFMEEQVKTLLAEYQKKLKEIEDTFMLERAELIDEARKEWEREVEGRRGMEQTALARSLGRVDEHEEELDALRQANTDEYLALKASLETEIQQLEQQVQQLRATCLLNSEKLEYNHQVLKKRDEENTVTITQQKRKITRLQDVLNQLKSKTERQERTFKDDNDNLTEDYLRITEQFRDLQRKFRHFQSVDQRQYEQVWTMSEETVTQMAHRLMDADRAIHEQQLGLTWVPPVDAVFHSSTSDKSKKASEALVEVMSEGENISNSAIKHALALLCDEAGFLVEGRLHALLAPLAADQQRMMRLDAIFKALGIESAEDMRRLAAHFVRTVDGEEQLVHADEATAALRRFVEEHRRSKNTELLAATEEVTTRNVAYWKDVLTVLPESHLKTWKSLSESLAQYEKILTERGRLIAETKGLKQQNEELRVLLSHYMGSKINDELQIPPTRVLPTLR